MQTVIGLFCKQLQIQVRRREVNHDDIVVVLSASVHLNPFQAFGDAEPGFSLMTSLLNSKYPEDSCYQMACGVMELLGRWFDSVAIHIYRLNWIPALLGFLSLCEKFYTTQSPPYPGLIALRILSTCPEYPGFSTMVLPILTPILLPTHPLQSRSLALKVFYQLMHKWSPPQRETVLANDLNRLLQAVGDPFQSIPEGESMEAADCGPVVAAVTLIGLMASDLWHNHLHHSNFTSCEEIVSTEEGRRTFLISMFNAATHSWSKLLSTPAQMVMAIRHLEELQCINTAEVVISWAWAIGVVSPVDHDGWRLIEHDTLRFYQAHGTGRLTTLSQHITDMTIEAPHSKFLTAKYGNTPCLAKKPLLHQVQSYSRNHRDLCISQVCQLRRLYYLFGFDSMIWKEAVAATVEVGSGEGSAGGIHISSGCSMMPIEFMDHVCDYP